LAYRLTSIGFRLDGASVFQVPTFSWDDIVYSKGFAELIRDFVTSRGDVPAKDVGNWLERFSQLDEKG
jgi:hypothetical protein